MCILPDNCTKMWPMYVDYSEEECRRVLRSLELEAYANIVSAFRAQGNLSKERKKMLQDLCSMLGITMERHRAEIRRAVNDEHLNTIAERLTGPNTSTEWAIEGRRVIPLMPRLAPQTVFTAVADSAANAQAAKNASLPLPGRTGAREISNGLETMTSRKRKELPPDSSASPHKMAALDSEYLNSLVSFENANCGLPESSQTPSGSSNSESFSPPDSTSQVSSSFSEQAPAKTTASLLTSSAPSSSPVKPPPKQIMLKSSSTVTTFSSYDQLNSNLLSSRTPTQSPAPAPVYEEQAATVSEVPKVSSEAKTSQRVSPSISLKTTTILPTTTSSSSTSSSSDRLSMSSSTSSMGNKFLTQIRCKNTSHSRQSLPSSLGLKLNSQSPIGQKGLSPKSSPSLKVKQDNASNFFTKKITQTVFSSSPSETPSQFSISNTSESSPSVPKSPVSVSKSSVKIDSSVVSSSQTSNKLTTVTKTFPKTSTPSSQYMARSLFSSSTKTGAKSLPQVIFNVSTSSVTPLQTTTKTTVSMQNDGPKTTPQLLPKVPSVAINPSQLKIKAPNSIQYRNDGGVVRSARIVNISQPVGSRLPCAITPSAISALGLASNITSTALRVTLPAGTLNTSAGMRVSAAAKPNVIVVHKAQMWPRTQQGAAVIMSSAASLPKISNDVNVNESIAQKQEKGKLQGAKLAPRPIAPTQNAEPGVTAATLKIPETSLLANPLANNKSTHPDSSVSGKISSPQEVVSQRKLQETVNQKKPPEALNQKKPPEAVNQKKPPETVNQKKSHEAANQKKPPQEAKCEKGVFLFPYRGLQPPDNQCKKNLLADVISESGILESASEKVPAPIKDKAKDSKDEKGHASFLDSEAKILKKSSIASSTIDSATTVSHETNVSKPESIKKISDTESMQSRSENGKSGISIKACESSSGKKEISEPLVTSSQVGESLLSSVENNSSVQVVTPKEKNL